MSIGLNGRNFTQLIALAPGVSNQTGQDEAKVGVVGSVKYSVNGGRVEYNTFEVDGSDVLNTGLNGAASTLMVYPSLDAIQEVKVLTSNYGAQYGRTASGTVQVTTKSGTADSGTAISTTLSATRRSTRAIFSTWSIRSRRLPGRCSGGQTIGNKAPLYRRQDFGGTIGGPLYIPHVFNTQKEQDFFLLLGGISVGENSDRVQPGGAGVERAWPDSDNREVVQKNLQTQSGNWRGLPGLRFQRRLPVERRELLCARNIRIARRCAEAERLDL